VLRSIKELEFDHAMGKVAKADFDEMSARLRGRAMGLLKQLDAGGGYRDQIAQEVQRRLEGDGFSHRPDPETRVDAEESADSATAKAVALQTSTCSECDTVNDADAKFCKNCGAKL